MDKDGGRNTCETTLSDLEDISELGIGDFPASPMKAMDDLLEECFLQAIKSSMDKFKLPMLASTFYSAYILPQCPTHLRLDIRRSSFRKLSRFLHMMTEKGVVAVKETGKGVQSLISINQDHPIVQTFSPLLLAAEDCKDKVAHIEDALKPEISVTELYSPSLKLLPVFRACGHGKASLLTVTEVKEALTRYAEINNLTSSHSPGSVHLDPILHDGLSHKSQFLCEEMTWADLSNIVIQSMKPAYQISHGDSQPVIRKGLLQPVSMIVVQRAGNKKVTLVENLELYGISAEKLSHTAQRTAAASATVEVSSGSERLLVQGNAVKLLAKVLQDEYGLPLQYIIAVDKVKPRSGRK
jgi:translation initiation factor 2D